MDLSLDSSGDLELQDDDLLLVTGSVSLAQRIRVSLDVLRGEWALDLSAGIDWLGSVLVKNPDLAFLDAIFRARIVEVPGVDRILSLELDLDESRRLRVSFRVLGTQDEDVASTYTLDGDGDVLSVLAED